MTKTITFNELRRLKDSLPDGSSHRIADELGISVETVRNYFGGHNFTDGKSCGIHIEPGPDGGLVVLDVAVDSISLKLLYVFSWSKPTLSNCVYKLNFIVI